MNQNTNTSNSGIGSLVNAFMRGARITSSSKHARGWRKPKNWGTKRKARRKMAAKSRARNFKNA